MCWKLAVVCFVLFCFVCLFVFYPTFCYVWRSNEDLNDSQMFYLPLTRVIRYG